MCNRLNFLDVARAYAIALALFAHAMLTFGGWDLYGESWVRIVTRTATPLFIFICGVMLEVVYARQMRREGVDPVAARLLSRAAQCYFCFALTAVAGFLGGSYAFPGLVRELFLLTNISLCNILILYAFTLAAAPALIWLRNRFGPVILVILLGAVWVVDGLVLARFEDTSFGFANPWVSRVLGTGLYQVGPSVVHGLTFVLAGMLAGTALNGWRERGFDGVRRKFYAYAGGIFLVAFGVAVALAVCGLGPLGVLEGFRDYSKFRVANHIGYYAVGLTLCITTLVTFSILVPRNRLGIWTAFPLQFGRYSLLSFTIGNSLLSLVPRDTLNLDPRWTPVLAVAFLLVVLVLVNTWRVISSIRPRFSRHDQLAGQPLQ